jgi:hypothetical protein
MKKFFISLLTLLFVVGIFSAAFAASSPAITFSDLPSNHWAYKAVSDLAKAGIIDGYADGKFRGERIMTRYEMALIVANVMTKEDKVDAENKAIIEKLVKEFKEELLQIDSRLSKVEEKTRLTISGTEQFFVGNNSIDPKTFGAWKGTGATGLSDQTWAGQRLRLYITAPDANNQFVFNARLYQQTNNTQMKDANTAAFDRMTITANNMFGGTVELGKSFLYLGKGAFVGYTGGVDGVQYTNKSGFLTTRLGEGNFGATSTGEFSFAQISYKPNETNDIGAYVFQNNAKAAQLIDVMGTIGIGSMGLQFEAAKNNYRGQHETGYIVSLLSKATAGGMVPQNNSASVNTNKVRDSAWGLSYRHLPDGVSGTANVGSGTSFLTILTDTAGNYANTFDGVNVVGLDYYYVPIKNVMLTLEYNHIKPIVATPTWSNNYIVSSLTYCF